MPADKFNEYHKNLTIILKSMSESLKNEQFSQRLHEDEAINLVLQKACARENHVSAMLTHLNAAKSFASKGNHNDKHQALAQVRNQLLAFEKSLVQNPPKLPDEDNDHVTNLVTIFRFTFSELINSTD